MDLSGENDLWELIVKYNGDLERIRAELDIEIEILSDNYAIVTLISDLVDALSSYPEIEYIEQPKNLSFSLGTAAVSACISSVQNDFGYGLTGNGVIVAIVDSGIDYTHPDFKTPDGRSRIVFFWDQMGQPPNPPAGFYHGVEYTNDDLNKALSVSQPFSVIPELDLVGHGTAVAGAAAGNGRASRGVNIGSAPEASIIAVRLGRTGERSFVRNTELMRALKYCVDKSQALNMPVVINISYGTNNGSHDGTSLFETFVDEIAQKWKTSIVVASGNEGAAAHHYSAQINSGEINDARFYTSDGLRSFYISCWKNFVDSFTIELILPDGKSTGEISEVDRIRTWRFGNIRVSIDFNQPNQYSENQEIFFQAGVLNGYLASGQWIVRIRAIKSVVGRFDMWLPVLEEISAGTAFFNPDPHITITLPATSERVISVGGYNHRTDTFADFSGRGFTREGRHKPDICAPAVGILTPRKGGGYDAFTGTSIAAPIVTGSVALLMEWGITQGNDPFLYGQKIKAYLKSGAIRIATQSYPNPEWGYGKLCLRNSMEQLAQYF